MANERQSLLLIVSHLRSLGTNGGSFADVFGKVPRNSDATFFWSSIMRLLATGYIEIRDSKGSNKIGKDMLNASGVFGFGHNATSRIDGNEGDFTVALTGKLSEVQEVLGVSLRALIEGTRGGAMTVTPIFGPLYGDYFADVFVVMPFSADMTSVYENHIKKAVLEMNLTVLRGDAIFGGQSIMHQVWELISQSKVIVADCTGRNPNVFYELGIAHTLGKEVILTTQSSDDVSFDIKHIRYIKYIPTLDGMVEFEATLKLFIAESVERVTNYENMRDGKCDFIPAIARKY